MGITLIDLVDPGKVAESLRLIWDPGQITEVRAVNATTASVTRPGIMSSYFDYVGKLVGAIGTLTSASGIYVLMNHVDPSLTHRVNNCLRPARRGGSTSDADVVKRVWLLIDCDPIRCSAISSTDIEHDAAIQRACDIRDWLSELGWPKPLVADSGNGAHLMYRIALPRGDSGLV